MPLSTGHFVALAAYFFLTLSIPFHLLSLSPHSLTYSFSVDDGCVKVWRNYASEMDREEVTSWRAVSDMIDSPKSKHSVDRCQIVASTVTNFGPLMPRACMRVCVCVCVCVCVHPREAKLRSFPEAGVVLGWEQPTGLLYATGDVRYIRVWDTHKEMKIQVSCLSY